MGLVKPGAVHRVAIPHEPGGWMEFRQVPWEQWPDKDPLAGKGSVKAILVLCIAAWSYPEPVTAENVGLLDVGTMVWASQEAVRINGGADLANLVASSNGTTSATKSTRTK